MVAVAGVTGLGGCAFPSGGVVATGVRGTVRLEWTLGSLPLSEVSAAVFGPENVDATPEDSDPRSRIPCVVDLEPLDLDEAKPGSGGLGESSALDLRLGAEGTPEFDPRVAAVRVGGTIRLRNRTSGALTPYFRREPNRTYPSGPLAPGEIRDVVVGIAGAYEVRLVEPATTPPAYLHATAAPLAIVCEFGREFAFPELEAGLYLLRAWHPILGEASRAVRLRSGEAVVADLVLRAPYVPPVRRTIVP
jgi:hypothetical protein